MKKNNKREVRLGNKKKCFVSHGQNSGKSNFFEASFFFLIYNIF